MKRCWHRQVVAPATLGQERFDLGAIVIAPLACFVLDPGVFRDGDWGTAILPNFPPGIYVAAAAAMGSYCISRFWRHAPVVAHAAAAGGQLCGAIVALVVG